MIQLEEQQELTATSGDNLDHYYCQTCYPEPTLYVKAFCGHDGAMEYDEIDITDDIDCVVCLDIAWCEVCNA